MYIKEITGKGDYYVGSHLLYAGYGLLDFPIYSGLKLAGGVRYENSSFGVESFDMFSPGVVTSTEIKSENWLPAAALIFSGVDNLVIRTSYSRTTARPDFKEMSPFIFVTVAGGDILIGNPGLTETTIDSADLRFEYFPAAGQVLAWQPGLYRLDLLIEPAGRIRIVMLSVGPAGDRDLRAALGPGGVDRVADSGFRTSILRRLPAAAHLWTVGEILTGWARPPIAGDCQVAQIWRARGPDAGCWPVPIGPTTALGVNLPAGQQITAITLTEVDPLPGPVALRSDLAVGGRPGLAALRIPDGTLPDGIYRLSVRVADGSDLHWYIEVGPEGRRAAAINAFVTGYQR